MFFFKFRGTSRILTGASLERGFTCNCNRPLLFESQTPFMVLVLKELNSPWVVPHCQSTFARHYLRTHVFHKTSKTHLSLIILPFGSMMVLYIIFLFMSSKSYFMCFLNFLAFFLPPIFRI